MAKCFGVQYYSSVLKTKLLLLPPDPKKKATYCVHAIRLSFPSNASLSFQLTNRLHRRPGTQKTSNRAVELWHLNRYPRPTKNNVAHS